MGHNRKLVLGAVALVKVRVRGNIEVMTELRDEIESVLIASEWFPKAPFQWVGLIFRYGLKNDATPEFKKINKKHGDLPLTIEIDTHQLLELQKDKNALKNFLRAVTLNCLLAVADKYDLPKNGLLETHKGANAT